jgi:hypothetical protein
MSLGKGAMRAAISCQLPTVSQEEAPRIRLITAPYFLATKLEAFAGRGEDDIWGSHDLEDVVTLIDGRPEIFEEVSTKTLEDVRQFIAQTFGVLLKRPGFEEAVEGHLPADARNRLGIVMDRMRRIASIPRASAFGWPPEHRPGAG